MIGNKSNSGRMGHCIFWGTLLLLLFLGAPSFGQELKRVGIVYSAVSADNSFSKLVYSQLFLAMQHQAMMAGIPFDLLSEDQLTDVANLVGYSALLIPSLQHVNTGNLAAIESALAQASSAYGIGLITAGEFMTNDETGAPLPGDPYSRMKNLLGLAYSGGSWGVEATVTAGDISHPVMAAYTPGEQIRLYAPIWFAHYLPGPGQAATRLVELRTTDGVHAGAWATVKGGRNVHFANHQLLGDNNLVWPALQWVVYGQQTPVALKLGRNASLFVARNDMDTSRFAEDLHLTDVPLLDLITRWKRDYNFLGSYYLNIGNDPAAGQYTDWAVSGPLFRQYLALGSEIGTHSNSHVHDTNQLSPSELEFEFNQSKLEIGAQLGIPVVGAAIPGMPEGLAVDEQLSSYFSYLSGRAGVVGAGYPGGFGYLTPNDNMLYYSLNLSPDYTLVEFQGHTAAEASQIWQREYAAQLKHAAQPIIHWLWHDYGATTQAAGPYSLAMYEDTIAMAYKAGSEFATLQDVHGRIQAFQGAALTVEENGALTASVKASNVGQFSLQLPPSQPVRRVDNWYAYDSDQIFLPQGGGQFTIREGSAPTALTRITALPMRAKLLSLTGDGTALTFSFEGEGAVTVQLNPVVSANLSVKGADASTRTGNTLVMRFNQRGLHSASIDLASTKNQAPIAIAQKLTAQAGVPVPITLTGTDPNKKRLTFQIVPGWGPTHGTLKGTPPALTYIPNPGFAGADSFEFIASDGSLNSAPAAIDLTILAANQPPVANPQSLRTEQGLPLPLTLTATDPEGAPISFRVVSNPAHGTLGGTAPNLIYTPNPGFAGSDSFTFTASDGALTSPPTSIAITVAGGMSNFLPNITLDGSLAEWATLASFGPDPADVAGAANLLDWREAWMAHNGSNIYLALRNSGNIALSWAYNLYLDTDGSSATGYRQGSRFPIGADYLLQGGWLYRYTGDGSTWSWISVVSVPAAVSGSGAEFAIPRSALGNPSRLRLFFLGENSAYPGGTTQDLYPDQALDPNGALRFFTYTPSAGPANQPPVANPQALSTPAGVSLPISLTATDPNGDPLSFRVSSGPTNGTLSGTAPALSYTPNAGFTGSDSFSFVANDGVLDSPPATVSIGVAAPLSNFTTGITLDGNLVDWGTLVSFGPDPADATGAGNLLDYREGWLAHDSSNLYLALRNNANIALSWAYNLYLDTDGSSASGFHGGSSFPIGAEYLFQGSALYRYTGTGSSWSWSLVAAMTQASNGPEAEFAIPRAALGNPASLRLFFYGDNTAYAGGTALDLYPDLALDPTGATRFFSYTLGP
jgi:Bacterial Ig domain